LQSYGRDGLHSRTGFKRYYAGLHRAFGDLSIQVHENVWDGTITESGSAVDFDFTSADFLRIENGLVAEHWDTVDYVRLYQSFGLLPGDRF
jgi:predicted SnoaL-like aldol condensation-catalyzing enzyme